jgi:hypothetical protein
MSVGKPPWWRAFDRVERTLGRPLEDAANSSRGVDVMLRAIRLQRAIGGGLGRLAGGATERVLHVANMPTRGDIQRLSRQLATLTSELRALSADQREALAALRRERARKAGAPSAERRRKGSELPIEPRSDDAR